MRFTETQTAGKKIPDVRVEQDKGRPPFSLSRQASFKRRSLHGGSKINPVRALFFETYSLQHLLLNAMLVVSRTPSVIYKPSLIHF